MRLFHFSDDPHIEKFVPRPVETPSSRPSGQEWLNGPLVWAIEDAYDFLYLFPRDCPRIVIWAATSTSEEDRGQWLGSYHAAAYIERDWLEPVSSSVLHRYEMPNETFENLSDAGMWISRATVVPLNRVSLHKLRAGLVLRNVDLRVVDRLAPLKNLWSTSLHVSGIRLRNAPSWQDAVSRG